MQVAQEIERAVAAYSKTVEADTISDKPIVTNFPVDPELQPGESAKLGGAMEIKSPWAK